jgi:threonine dehydrogenase-like Zn-dependent dehydrogenase
MEEFLEPTVGPTELLIRVGAANVCQTDVKKWDDSTLVTRLQGHPLILGHELAGTVVLVGEEVTSSFRVGDRVAVDPVIREGLAYFEDAYGAGRDLKRDLLLGVGAAAGDPVANAVLFELHGIGGGFAELVKIPAMCAIKLPAGMSLEEGSLVEPVADVVRSVRAVGDVVGRQCAVFGLGPMGLLHVAVLAQRDAHVIGVDPRADRRDACATFGAAEFRLPGDTPTVDCAFLAVGGPALEKALGEALGALRRGGALVLFSSGLADMNFVARLNKIHYDELRIFGVVGATRSDLEGAVDVLRSGAINVAALRHPRVEFTEVQRAFQLMGQPGAQKVGLTFAEVDGG